MPQGYLQRKEKQLKCNNNDLLTIIQAGESPHACPAIAGKKPPTGDLIGGFCLPGSRRGGSIRCRARVVFGSVSLGGKVRGPYIL